jgi:DNA-binding response OmpR family regulator
VLDIGPPGTDVFTVLRHGGLSLDLRTRRVLVDGTTIDLTGREFLLAEAFFRNAGQVLSRHLRQKVEAERIQTVRGTGYRLE